MTGLTELARAHQSVSRSPNSGACLSNLAHQLRLVDRPLEALSWSRWAVRPSAWPEGHVDQRALRVLGAVLIDVGLFAAADEAYQAKNVRRAYLVSASRHGGAHLAHG